MGALIAVPVAAASSCLGACAATCACKACGSCCPSGGDGSKDGATASTTTKIPYLLLAFLGVVLALIMRYASGDFLDQVARFELEQCETDICLETQSAYRVCFAMFLFFVLCAVLSAVYVPFHYQMWAFKYITFGLLLVLLFFVPNEFFNGWIEFARVGAGIFLLLQVIVFISVSYDLNSDLVSREDSRLLYAILGVSAVLYIVSIVFWVLFFGWYTDGGNCSLEETFIILTILTSVALTGLSISQIAPHGALLTSATVTAYNTFVLYNALSSNPSEQCNPGGVEQDEWQVVLGLAIGAASLTYRALTLTRSNVFAQQETEEVPDVDIEQAAPVEGNASHATTTVVVPDTKKGEIRSSNVRFHILMALAACYFSMVISNWGSTSSDRFQISEESMWVAIITQWITAALYTWTLIAPRCCPNRDFGVDLG